MLAQLQHNFNIIRLSEIKLSSSQTPLNNFTLPGYDFVYQPSLSSAGGVAIYVKDDLKFHVRHELSSVNEEFESLWIEIENHPKKNILCAIIYTDTQIQIQGIS